MKTQSNIPDEIYKNIKEYRPLELDYNVHTAVENLKTAYWSNEPKKVATAFKEAEDIIISAICYDNYNVCKELQEVETERPQGEWIPVSERLPDNEKEVLIQYGQSMMVGYHLFDFTMYPSDFEDENETGWYDSEDNFICGSDEVIAWMPLPEPYQKGGTE